MSYGSLPSLPTLLKMNFVIAKSLPVLCKTLVIQVFIDNKEPPEDEEAELYFEGWAESVLEVWSKVKNQI